MTDILEAFTRAVAHHQAGVLSEAEAIYRQILAVDPDHALALNNLGLITPQDEALALFSRAVAVKPDYVDALINLGNALHARGEIDEATARYEQAVALRPGSAAALNNLGNVLRAQGKLDDAIACYERGLAADPNNPDIHFGVGCILQAQGKLDAAIARYERAIALKPDFVAALHNLGTVHDMAKRPGSAAKWFRWALALNPNLNEANIGMVKLLESEGRLAEAKVFRDRVARPHPLAMETAPAQHRVVLLPSVVGPGNVPVHGLLRPRTNTCIGWSVDYATDDQEEALPPYDVAFNAVGNADLMGPSFARLARFHARRPMLNPPAAVAPTRRDLLPGLLAGIPNVLVPPVLRLRRDEVIDGDLAARLAAAGIVYPFLMRPIVMHSGGGMILVETPEQLAGVTLADADAFYFIAYYDYRGVDGYYRKYRMIYVDREPYPYHLAISEHWLVHYFSANMNSAPWKREEEERFRANPAAALGPDAMTAIAAIGKRVNLDFAGIDFSVLPDGRVLVFEANATMSVYLPETGDDAAEFVYASAIVKAFDAMLERHAKTQGAGSGPRP